VYGLQKALESKNTCTIVYSSGLQVSGTIVEFRQEKGLPSFVKLVGPTALAVNDKQLKGHGKGYHKDGFSSPVGKLKGYTIPIEDFTEGKCFEAGIQKGKTAYLEFESGITLTGKMKSTISNNGKLQVVTFEECTVKDADGNILFDPSWGVYDMAVGELITSVFCGAADKDAFEEISYKSNTGTHHIQFDSNTLQLHRLYQQVRDSRQTQRGYDFLGNVWEQLQINHQDDWLCAMEILEILDHENLEPALATDIRLFLKNKAATEPELKKLISDGFYLIKHPVEQKLVV